MTLMEAFPLFLSFLVSFFMVQSYSTHFGFLGWVLAIVIG